MRAPPVPFADIDAVVRADLGDDVFTSIDPEPLATASIAQTHLALFEDRPARRGESVSRALAFAY